MLRDRNARRLHSVARPGTNGVARRCAHLLELQTLLVQHLCMLAQNRALTHDSRLEHFPMLDLFAQCVSLGSELGRLRIELLLADPLEELRPLSSGIALLLRAAARHACWAPCAVGLWRSRDCLPRVPPGEPANGALPNEASAGRGRPKKAEEGRANLLEEDYVMKGDTQPTKRLAHPSPLPLSSPTSR